MASVSQMQLHAPTHTENFYNPKKSRTSTILSCQSVDECMEYFDVQRSRCVYESHNCLYLETYMDGSWSRGILATEKFTFSTSTGGTSEIPVLVFGCASERGGTTGLRFSGILVLEDQNEHSLVHRVGKKFSYCIGNISDRNYIYNQLILGEGAILEGDKTPMKFDESKSYVARLQGISVGEKELKIDRRDFEEFNVVIDSGTTLTLLVRSAFEKLKVEVDMLAGLVEFIGMDDERPCYRGDLVRDLKGFPTVTLHLDEGVDVSLDLEGMFMRERDGVFCMAVGIPSDGVKMIGVLAQQYYNVGFDLNAMRLSFLRIDCELLED